MRPAFDTEGGKGDSISQVRWGGGGGGGAGEDSKVPELLCFSHAVRGGKVHRRPPNRKIFSSHEGEKTKHFHLFRGPAMQFDENMRPSGRKRKGDSFPIGREKGEGVSHWHVREDGRVFAHQRKITLPL